LNRAIFLRVVLFGFVFLSLSAVRSPFVFLIPRCKQTRRRGSSKSGECNRSVEISIEICVAISAAFSVNKLN